MSVASVNSALQRARSTIAAANITDTEAAMPMDEAQILPGWMPR